MISRQPNSKPPSGRMPAIPESKNTLQQLQSRLKEPLPGLPAMLPMAPPFREALIKQTLVTARPKTAAVLIPIHIKNESIHIILTKRSAHPGVHSSQISFPGGRMEPGDEDLCSTALRETREELQLTDTRIEVFGTLTPLYIPPSNYWVHPFVGILHQPPTVWSPQKAEVALVLEPSLRELFDPTIRVTQTTQTTEGPRAVPGFQVSEHFIWGATAMILEEFLSLLRP